MKLLFLFEVSCTIFRQRASHPTARLEAYSSSCIFSADNLKPVVECLSSCAFVGSKELLSRLPILPRFEFEPQQRARVICELPLVMCVTINPLRWSFFTAKFQFELESMDFVYGCSLEVRCFYRIFWWWWYPDLKLNFRARALSVDSLSTCALGVVRRWSRFSNLTTSP